MRLYKGKYYLVNISKESVGEAHIHNVPVGSDKIGKLVLINPQEKEIVDKILYTKYRYLFEFIDNIDGHNGNSPDYEGKRGHCWWVRKRDIKRKVSDDEVMVELL